MKHNKIFAVAIAALFCLGAIPLFAVEDTSVSGDDLPLSKGVAWGQSFELKYSDIEPLLDEALIADGIEGGFDAYLDSAIKDEISKDFLISPDKVGLDLGFTIMEAVLIDVVDATADGYKVDYLLGLMVKVSADVSIEGKLPKAGTYTVDQMKALTEADLEDRNTYMNIEMFMKFTISGTVDFNKDGAITGLSMDLGINLSGGIKTNMDMNANVKYNDNGEAVSGEIVFAYGNKDYNVSVHLNTSTKLKFNGTGLTIIPFDLKAGTTSVDTTISLESISMSGKVSMSDDAKGMIDHIMDKDGFTDSILAQTDSGNVNLGADELEAMNQMLALIPIKYTVDVVGDDVSGYDVTITNPLASIANGGLGLFMNQDLTVGADMFYELDVAENEEENSSDIKLPDFKWEDFLSFDMFGLLTGFMPESIKDLIKENPEKFGDMRTQMTMATLDEDGRSKVRSTFTSIQEYNEDDDDKLLIYVGIGVAAVAAIAIVFFLIRRS